MIGMIGVITGFGLEFDVCAAADVVVLLCMSHCPPTTNSYTVTFPHFQIAPVSHSHPLQQQHQPLLQLLLLLLLLLSCPIVFVVVAAAVVVAVVVCAFWASSSVCAVVSVVVVAVCLWMHLL